MKITGLLSKIRHFEINAAIFLFRQCHEVKQNGDFNIVITKYHF